MKKNEISLSRLTEFIEKCIGAAFDVSDGEIRYKHSPSHSVSPASKLPAQPKRLYTITHIYIHFGNEEETKTATQLPTARYNCAPLVLRCPTCARSRLCTPNRTYTTSLTRSIAKSHLMFHIYIRGPTACMLSLSLCVWWCDDGLNDGTYIRSPTATLDKFALHVHTASRRHWTFRHSTLGVCFKSSGARLWQTIDRWRTYLLVIWCRPKRQSSLYHSLTKSSHCSLFSNNIYSEGWFGAEPQLITDWPPF